MQNPPRALPAIKSSARRLSLWILTLLAASAIWTSFQVDEPVRQAVVQSQGKGWKKSADFRFQAAVRKLGDWPWIMLAGGLGIAISWKTKKREWVRILAAAMVASTIAGLLANASRLTTGRTRPRESPKIEQGFYGPWREGRLTIGDPPFNSFPSGHTATAFGFAGVILFARVWLGIGALALAGLVAWSSIMVGAHHPSDVVVSICLSLWVAWFTWKWAVANGDAFARKVWAKMKSLRKEERRLQ
ncbi:MAG TPA: phosphatase PAP2 family protein [Terrimicrobiaceae bacterium]|nr:phosphatase PAP2 family protein [Terrimicrobiaceae bacterium]